MNRKSKRFTTSRWSEQLVPALFILLVLGLVVTMAIVVLSMVGIFSG